MGVRPDGRLRFRDPAAGDLHLLGADIGRRSGGRALRLRRDPRRRSPLHHRLRRVLAQRRRHRC